MSRYNVKFLPGTHLAKDSAFKLKLSKKAGGVCPVCEEALGSGRLMLSHGPDFNMGAENAGVVRIHTAGGLLIDGDVNFSSRTLPVGSYIISIIPNPEGGWTSYIGFGLFTIAKDSDTEIFLDGIE